MLYRFYILCCVFFLLIGIAFVVSHLHSASAEELNVSGHQDARPELPPPPLSLVNLVSNDDLVVGSHAPNASITQHPRHSVALNMRDNTLRDAMTQRRIHDVTMWSLYLFDSHYFWYRLANASDTLGKIFQVSTPILTSLGIYYKDSWFTVGATISGTVVVALTGLSHYAKKESVERGDAVNRILISEGVQPIIVPHDNASTTDR